MDWLNACSFKKASRRSCSVGVHGVVLVTDDVGGSRNVKSLVEWQKRHFFCIVYFPQTSRTSTPFIVINIRRFIDYIYKYYTR